MLVDKDEHQRETITHWPILTGLKRNHCGKNMIIIILFLIIPDNVVIFYGGGGGRDGFSWVRAIYNWFLYNSTFITTYAADLDLRLHFPMFHLG